MNTLCTKTLACMLILVSSIMVAGCQTVGKTLNLDTDLTLKLKAQKNINPDESKKAAPLFIRFYELKSDSLFKRAEFVELYERDEEILANDLISKKELKRILPSESREETFVLNADTKFIALFAEFYRYNEAQYRVVFPVKSNNIFNDKITIDITNNSINIVTD